MKRICAVLLPAFVLAAITPDISHAQNGGYAVTERGANYRVLQKTTVEHGTNRVHRYTELATGLNYQNSHGQWTESKEEIDLQPNGGAAAVQGQHQVYFPADIYDGVLEVVTPDGRQLRSRPLGVSYDDGSNTVFIATLTNSIGVLTASNQVTYPNAFTDIKADLVCTYRKSGFECDLVFREKPPTPDAYGLDPDTSTLQLVTEFFNTQDPQEIPGASDEWFGLQDDTLKFGKLTMTHGKAFSIGSSGSNSAQNNNQSRFTSAATSPVYKRWLHLQGRTFLIEELPLVDVADDLNTLPEAANAITRISNPAARIQKFASNHRQMPPAHEFVSNTKQILVAAANLNQKPGVVLDYDEVDSDTNDFTFQADTTYLIGGELELDGTTTIEPGAVLKYAHYGSIDLGGPVDCETSPDNPVVLTAVDDSSVGESLNTNHPTGYYGVDAYVHTYVAPTLNNIRIKYAGSGFDLESDVTLLNVEFEDCYYGFYGSDGNTLKIDNALFHDLAFIFAEDYWQVIGSHWTADGCGQVSEGNYSTISLTNSLLTAITGSWGDFAVTTNHVVLLVGDAGVFQTAALAGHYLATSSIYRNAGTTSIDSDVLTNIEAMTTYAPPDGGWPDTNAPDLGYHYPVDEDSDFDGLPDWWEWKYFGHFGVDLNADPDGDGVSNFQEYLYGIDPNKINFSISVPNPLLATNIVNATITILGGLPSDIAVLADSTNFTGATWSAYTSSNILINISTNQGVHDVWVGLRGLPADAYQSWQDIIVTLDSTTPAISITNPVNNISFNASRVNVMGSFKADLLKQVTVNGVLAFISGTNFDALNVPLVARTNKITAVVEMLNGTSNTASINIITTTNANGSLNDPMQLQVTPVLGMAPLQATLQILSNNVPGSIQQRFYDFDGDNIMDQSANNLSAITHTYTNYGEYFPVMAVQTKIGSGQSAAFAWFSSSGGLNATNSNRVKVRAIQPGITNIIFPAQAVNTNTFYVTLQGYPQATVSILVNGTNLNNVTGQTNYANLDTGLIQAPVYLGTTDGVYYVSVGVLNGTNYTWTTTKIVLDTVPPQIVPASCSVTTNLPLLQLTGYATETLSAIAFDVVNSQTTNLNQMGFVVASDGNTFAGAVSTNWFQCFDIELASGLNTITVRCVDLAGNVSTNVYLYTLDTSAMTAPILSVDWPANNTVVSGSNVTIHGYVSDPTAAISAHYTENGSANDVFGVVERDGTFWIDNVPLNNATNLVQLTATNMAGQSATSNLTVQTSPVIVAVDPVSSDALQGSTVTVTGTASSGGYTVTVNGVTATVAANPDGSINWSADNVPLGAGGVASFQVQATPVSGGGSAVTVQANNDLPAFIRVAQYNENLVQSNVWFQFDECSCDPPGNCYFGPEYHVESYEQRIQSWQLGVGGAGSDSSFLYSNIWAFPPTVSGPADTNWIWTASDVPTNFPWEHCESQINYEMDACPQYPNSSSYHRTAQTRVELVVGGRAVPGQPTLVTLKVAGFTNGIPVSPASITVNNLICASFGDGTNGFVTVSAPAGTTNLDVTPQVTTTADTYTFNVEIAKDKAYWQNVVKDEIDGDNSGGVAIENYKAGNGFLNNRENIKAVYGFYEKLFTNQPTEFYWAGLAKLAGAPVYAGLSDAEYLKRGLITDGIFTLNLGSLLLAYKAAQFQTNLIGMNIAVYNDLAWQFEAYRKGGTNALAEANVYDPKAFDIGSWQLIDQGIQLNDAGEIQAGNELLLQREQQIILTPGYVNLSRIFPGTTSVMSDLALNPVANIPALSFSALEPNGNIANFLDRWDWITRPYTNNTNTGMLPLWLLESPTARLNDVQQPLLYRAQPYSWVYIHISSSWTLY